MLVLYCIINVMGYLLGFRFPGNLAMGINLETRRYKMFLTRCGVSVYSRLCFGRWDHLHLGLSTLGTALALYSVIIGLHLLLQHEVCLPVAVLVLVYSYLGVVLLPSKVSVSSTAKGSNINCVCEIERDHTFLHVIKLLPRPFPRQFAPKLAKIVVPSSCNLVQFILCRIHTHDSDYVNVANDVYLCEPYKNLVCRIPCRLGCTDSHILLPLLRHQRTNLVAFNPCSHSCIPITSDSPLW